MCKTPVLSDLKQICIINSPYHCFDDIISINDEDLDNILLDEKSCKTFIIMTLHAKFHTVQSL